jgi:hypothetical protein
MNEYLRQQYARQNADRNFGYAHDSPGRDRPRKQAAAVVSQIVAADRHQDTALWPALFRVWPAWAHGLQGTGDCVSWGTAHLGDILLAILYLLAKVRRPDGLISSESIYGFGKSELFDNYGWHGAGMNGSDALAAWRRFGTLYRRLYEAGSQKYDLSQYSGARAVAWGEQPRQTHGVPDELEPFAAEHKCVDEVAVTDAATAGALIQAGYPCQYCGGVYWGVERDSNGIARRFASGSHCMTITGVRYDGGSTPKYWWVANTGHGNHCSGPIGPTPMPPIYAECGSWVPNNRVEPILRQGDCFATSFVDGWPVLDLKDFGTPSEVLG